MGQHDEIIPDERIKGIGAFNMENILQEKHFYDTLLCVSRAALCVAFG